MNQHEARHTQSKESMTICGLNLAGPSAEDEHLSLSVVVNSVQETQHM